jgi:hypothetical protein
VQWDVLYLNPKVQQQCLLCIRPDGVRNVVVLHLKPNVLQWDVLCHGQVL